MRPRPVDGTIPPPVVRPGAPASPAPPALPGAPVKRLRLPTDIAVFKASSSYARLKGFIAALAQSVIGQPRASVVGSPVAEACRTALTVLRSWVEDIPLQDRHQSRFGNQAYRVFHARLEEQALSALIAPILAASPLSDEQQKDPELLQELKGYLLDSFGNATRIDYGTGHELHFIIFLYVLGQCGAADLEDEAERRAFVFGVVWEYVDLMRLLQRHYTMEPAGSHGVWGLDDFHHIPFILGAAQLSQSADADEFPPEAVGRAASVEAGKERYLYLAMVAWILDNKKGPFHEHSSVLYNVSGLDSWERIFNGMVKMFEGEVLQKIAVVQHLLFGKHFPLDRPSTTETA